MVPDECENALIRFYVSGAASDFVDFTVNARVSIEKYCYFLLPQWVSGRREHAEEIASDVLMRVYKSRARSQWTPGRSQLRTWLKRVTVRKVIDFIRANKNKPRLTFIESSAEAGWTSTSSRTLEGQFVSRLSVSDAIEYKELEDVAESILRGLPDDYQKIYALIISSGHTSKDAAAAVGISASVASRRMKEIRLMLCDAFRA